MPNTPERTDIEIAWTKYVKSVRLLLEPQLEDVSLYQYLEFRDSVIPIVESDRFLNNLKDAWNELVRSSDSPEIGKTLILELQSFPLAVEVAQATKKSKNQGNWWKKCLGRASTVSGSVKDLLECLPPFAKNAIILFQELIDLFKGGD